jgi:hypothetical protein
MRERALYGNLAHVVAMMAGVSPNRGFVFTDPRAYRGRMKASPGVKSGSACYAPYGRDPDSREAKRNKARLDRIANGNTVKARRFVRDQIRLSRREAELWARYAMREQLAKAEGPFVNG